MELHEVGRRKTGTPPHGKGASPAREAMLLVKELKPLFIKEGTIHAFHAMGGLPDDQMESKGVTLFKLTISLEAPSKTQIREALAALTESSVLRLIGTRLRPERSHRPLPQELRELLQLLKADQWRGQRSQGSRHRPQNRKPRRKSRRRPRNKQFSPWAKSKSLSHCLVVFCQRISEETTAPVPSPMAQRGNRTPAPKVGS